MQTLFPRFVCTSQPTGLISRWMKALSRKLLDEKVVVLIARVSNEQDSLGHLEQWLDSRDRERAVRFRFAEDRARFILGRGLLRKTLGTYLQKAADSITLGYTDRDRPIFPEDETIQFNLSHTQDLVAIALTAHARVGVDLEHMEIKSDLLPLAKRILSLDDYGRFQTLSAEELPAAFFRIWTRKEAYLKARGEGISGGIQRISVSFGPEATSSVADERENSSVERWRIINLPTPDNYMGCVACDDTVKSIECSYVRFEAGEIIRDSSTSLG
jgi:4'-phosphopantetheinyl transferase